MMMQMVGVFEVGQITQRLVFVGTLVIEVGFIAGAFWATDTFGRVLEQHIVIALLAILFTFAPCLE